MVHLVFLYKKDHYLQLIYYLCNNKMYSGFFEVHHDESYYFVGMFVKPHIFVINVIFY